jgi:dTDP-4-amino-4,6-dideoxygalactose transaminase
MGKIFRIKMIKFLDIYNQDKILHSKIIRKIKKLFKKGDYILGNEVKTFEEKFAKYTNSKYAIGCGNGTDAITIALKSLNLKVGSEVIIPAMTYCSTAFAVINANLKPILADINYLEPTINLNEIKRKITKKTKVILPVHLYGSVADISGIKKLIGKKKIYIIDDCAQAHGAKDLKGNKIGSISDISTFSLYPGKNLGAYGDAGVITTNNKKYYLKILKIRNLGGIEKFKHEEIGFNSRLDTIQAIVLNEKIENLSLLNKKRRKITNYYNKNINNPKVKKINYSKYCVYHQYVVLVKDKIKFSKYLEDKGIQFGYHYPKAIHELEIFKNKFSKSKFPNSEIISKKGVSIPVDPNLTLRQQKFITRTINEY